MNAKIENLEFDALIVEFKKALAASGLKYTKQREVLLRTLYNNNKHFTPEALHNEIKAKFPELNVGIATVYRTLNLLEVWRRRSHLARRVRNLSLRTSLTTTI